MFFGNSYVIVGNVKGGTDKTSYIGGKWNTQQCVSKATNQEFICNGITNSSAPGYCAPACCCVAYSTPGTKPGDWYLPMPGELYQIYANKTIINEKRTKFTGKKFVDGNYWSSIGTSYIYYGEMKYSEYYISFYFGSISSQDRGGSPYVLGFLALEI